MKKQQHTCNKIVCHLFPAIFVPQIHQTFNPSDPQILSPFRQPGAVLRQVLGPTNGIQASGMNPRSFGIFSAPASQRILVISSFGSAPWIHVDSHGSRWKVDVDPFMVLFSNPPKEGKTWVVEEHLEKKGQNTTKWEQEDIPNVMAPLLSFIVTGLHRPMFQLWSVLYVYCTGGSRHRQPDTMSNHVIQWPRSRIYTRNCTHCPLKVPVHE